MKKSFKFIQQFKSYYRSMSINSYRFWLTIIGIMIGVIVFCVGIIIIDSYTETFYDTYKDFGDDLIYVRNDNGFDDETLYYFDNQLSNSTLTYFTPQFVFRTSNSRSLLNYRIQGVSSNFFENYFFEPENAGVTINHHPEVSIRKWFQGRVWSNEEIIQNKRRIVINCFGAQLLFGNENPLNSYIEISGQNYQIVGIIANSKNTDNQIININNQCKKGEDFEGDYFIDNFPYIEIYTPISILRKDFHPEAQLTELMIRLPSLSEKNSVLSNIKYYYENQIENNNVFLSDTEVINKDIKDSLSEIKPTITIIMLFVLIISGMMTINTLFFNIKEKIPEIGIRKALGAKKGDILMQVIFEGILYTVLAFLLGLLISIIGLLIVKFITISNASLLFILKINPLHLLEIGLILFIEGIVVSIIPAIYAAKMKVVDAIKFE